MRSKLLAEISGLKTYAVIMETGDEVLSCLQAFADNEQLSAARLSAIGALSSASLRYFDWETKHYRTIPVEEQVEVACLFGDIVLAPGGGRAVHIHCVLGRHDGSALAGHLAVGYVRPTLEVTVTETPAHLQKRHDPETGLALIDITQ